MNAALSVFGLYVKRPWLAVRHAQTALRIVRTGGPRALLERVRSVVRASGEQQRRQHEIDRIYALLAAMPANAAANRAAILRELLPFAQDMSVLDVIHSDDERLRFVHCHLLRKFHLFDDAFYAEKYLEGIFGISPIDHYIQFGLAAGLRPNAYFDQVEYVGLHPEVAANGIDPILHYVLFGWREKKSAGTLFDGQFYLDSNPDVAKSGMSPLHHFLEIGRSEGRRPVRRGRGGAGLSRDRGTILLVSHDAELGGAQQVLRLFARWLLASTKFEVKFVTVRSGNFVGSFSGVAETFDLGTEAKSLSAAQLSAKLRKWAGPDVKAIVLNSVASGGFLDLWQDDTPILAFIHELPNILGSYRRELDLIKQRAARILGCCDTVTEVLREQFDVSPAKLATVYEFIDYDESRIIPDFGLKGEAKRAIGIDPEAVLVAGCGVLHWRKSPDKFIEAARKAIERGADNLAFVWVGGGPDEDECRRQVKAFGLEGRVHFIGYEADVMRYFNAADIFLLTSQEDPFPLACLEAALALSPIICFEKAGGMPDLVAKGCGVAVPFMDTDAMADALLRYAGDRDLRERDGRRGRALVEAGHTARSAGPKLLHHVREAAGIKPHVSVVVPNYNYERFLPERLETIAGQTFQDFELILLDDRSADGSEALLRQWAEGRPGTRVVVNEKNTGSPFAQWVRGIGMASADLVWIAEADDASEPEFLEALLPYFEDRNVFLAYAKSVPIGPEGQVYGDYEDIYLNRISPRRWSRSFVATDHEEAQRGLGIGNCIPNVSSALFRKFEIDADLASTLKSMRLAGDWYFYVRAMRGGLVAYEARALNLHRRHADTVTQSSEGKRRYFDEFAQVRRLISSTYRLGEPARAAIARFTTEDLDRFGVTDGRERARVLAESPPPEGRRAAPSLLVVLPDLSPGGGQILGIRLANTWVERGGRAVVLNVRHFPDHPKVVQKVDQRVPIYNSDDMGMTMEELIDRFDIEVVHSMVWWADRHVHENLHAIDDRPWAITMHGCHETIIDSPTIDLSFEQRVRDMLPRAAFIHTAEKNRAVFGKIGAPTRQLRIDNGIVIEPVSPLSRADLGLREDALVLCLASRGIPEKGWFEAVEMTQQLNRRGLKVDLMLLGDGPAYEEIAAAAPPFVRLFGHVENPQAYMRCADVGILPSYFIGESMPMVLLEMMANGMPVVATDRGEIPDMVGSGESAGGLIVPLKGGQVDIEAFVDAIAGLGDPVRLQQLSRNAEMRFASRFTIDRMVDAYKKLYAELGAAA